jgi:hypothetical protein
MTAGERSGPGADARVEGSTVGRATGGGVGPYASASIHIEPTHALSPPVGRSLPGS